MKTHLPRSGDLRILGLYVGRKTDILAFTAFLLALLGTALQTIEWTLGARINFYAPDRIAMYESIQQNGVELIRIAAPMSYTNNATAAYAANLRDETVEMRIGTRCSRQHSISFGTLRRKGSDFDPEYSSDAHPIPLQGASSASHTTFFGPIQRQCQQDSPCAENSDYIRQSEMTKLLTSAKTISFEFTARIYNHGAKHSQCAVTINDSILSQWMENNWFVARCDEVASGNNWLEWVSRDREKLAC